jgi:HNH endonuclease
MLTQEQLKSILHYNPETGIFTRLHWLDKRGRKWGGQINIGCISTTDGYLYISVNNKKHAAHRLAFLYIYGSSPINQIDHINGIRNDNRFINLRSCTAEYNLQNQRNPHTNNVSGLLGVHTSNNKSKSFRSKITANGIQKHIGYFKCKEEAHEAYLKAKRELHPFCTI